MCNKYHNLIENINPDKYAGFECPACGDRKSPGWEYCPQCQAYKKEQEELSRALKRRQYFRGW